MYKGFDIGKTKGDKMSRLNLTIDVISGEKIKFAIFGGAGFLGTHLKNYLRKRGHIVYILDNMDSGGLDNCKDPYYFDCDITSGFISQLPQIDYIVNMASIASPFFYRDKSLQTLRAGSVGMDNLCKIAIDRNIPLLHISTAKLINLDLSVSDSYDISKLFAEQTIKEHRKQGLKAKIARLYNVYGPGMLINDGRVVPAFIKKALKGEDITITANPEFSLTYVDDIIKGLYDFMFKITGGVKEDIVFGNDKLIKVIPLAKLIKKLTKSKSLINDDKCNGVAGLPIPNIDVAKEYLVWKPTTKLEDGLKIMIKDFKRRIK